MNDDGSISPVRIAQLLTGVFLSFNLLLIPVVVFLDSNLMNYKENVIINKSA